MGFTPTKIWAEAHSYFICLPVVLTPKSLKGDFPVITNCTKCFPLQGVRG